jgi:transposase
VITTLRYVGLDVHKETTTVAVAEGSGGHAVVFATIASVPTEVEATLAKLGGPQRIRCCYEAGPTGYVLVRHLRTAGYACEVVAPGRVPTDTSRVKTDRRDACRLAHFLRSGDLTPVAVPDATTEAIRDLVRAREDAKNAERVVRHQLQKFLLRHGRAWSKSSWTKDHWVWIRGQKFDHPALTAVSDDAVTAAEEATTRVARLTKLIGELVVGWSQGPLVKALQAFRGIQLVTAASLAAEIGDFKRFTHPRQLMAYLGLVPSEHSSGGSRRQGGITKTGNGHVRRLLVESAWNYRVRASRSAAIVARNVGVAPGVQAIAWKAQKRLHDRYVRLTSRGKCKKEVVVAIARELAGFVWAAACEPVWVLEAKADEKANVKRKPAKVAK